MIISSILGIGALIALLIDAPIWVFGAIVLYYNIWLDDQVTIIAKALEKSKEYIEYTTKVCSRFSDEEIQLLRSMTEEEYQLFENWIKSCKDLKEEEDDIK